MKILKYTRIFEEKSEINTKIKLRRKYSYKGEIADEIKQLNKRKKEEFLCICSHIQAKAVELKCIINKIQNIYLLT